MSQRVFSVQMSRAVGIKTKNKIIIKSHTSKKFLNRPVKKWNGKIFISIAKPESSFLLIKCGSRKAPKSELWKDSERGQ